jgi:hypothetical protein
LHKASQARQVSQFLSLQFTQTPDPVLGSIVPEGHLETQVSLCLRNPWLHSVQVTLSTQVLQLVPQGLQVRVDLSAQNELPQFGTQAFPFKKYPLAHDVHLSAVSQF